MKIAIEGCCHGELDTIYDHIARLESQNNYKVDLLLVCGDFQAFRNHKDLQSMACPDKYKVMGSFHKYYSGQKKAPILTIVVGGNHEASNYMWELYHGGWLAPNIYFLGHAGCVQVNGIRIAGMSGIYKAGDYRLGYYERVPYDQRSMRSIYHTRIYNVNRLAMLTNPDIFLSHDWPQSIERHGDLKTLLKVKQHFRASVDADTLGSPPLMMLLKTLQPKWWFAGHMHVRFEAEVKHDGEGVRKEATGLKEGMTRAQMEKAKQKVRIDGGGKGEENEAKQEHQRTTRFLALDKCLPNRDFLEVVDFPAPSSSTSSPQLTFDLEWLAITRAFHPFLSTERAQIPFPKEPQAKKLLAEARDWVSRNVLQPQAQPEGQGRAEPQPDGGVESPPSQPRVKLVEEVQRFVKTAPGVDETPEREPKAQPSRYSNPQTVAFCQMLGIENKINPGSAGEAHGGGTGVEDRGGLAVEDRGAFPPLGGAGAFPPLGGAGAVPPPRRGGGASRGGRWTGRADSAAAVRVPVSARRFPASSASTQDVTEEAFPPLGGGTRGRGRGRGRGQTARL